MLPWPDTVKHTSTREVKAETLCVGGRIAWATHIVRLMTMKTVTIRIPINVLYLESWGK